MALEKYAQDESYLMSPVTPSQSAAVTARPVFEDFSTLSEFSSRPNHGLQDQHSSKPSNVSHTWRQSRSEPLMPSLVDTPTSETAWSRERPRSAEIDHAKRGRWSRVILERSIHPHQSDENQSSPYLASPPAQELFRQNRVLNHQDLMRTPKDTLITFGLGSGGYSVGYVVKFDSFSVYEDFILTAPLDQWFYNDTVEPAHLGHPQRQLAPLLVALLPLQDIMEWIDHDSLLSFLLVQVTDWNPEDVLVKQEQSDATRPHRNGRYRVQRLRSFRSCDEASAAVFLDGYLQGISTIFACIVLDLAKTDPRTYNTIKMQCEEQMHNYRDIVVKEAGNKLFIY